MILDAQFALATAQAVTVSAVGENVYDTQSARDFGPGETLDVVIRVGTAFAGGTSISFELRSDGSNPPTTVVMATPAIVTASLTADTEVARLRIPYAGLGRYIMLYHTVVGTMTAGTIDAYVLLDGQANTV